MPISGASPQLVAHRLCSAQISQFIKSHKYIHFCDNPTAASTIIVLQCYLKHCVCVLYPSLEQNHSNLHGLINTKLFM